MSFKISLRSDAYYDLQAIIADGMRRIAAENHIYKCCWNCINVNKAQDKCNKYNVKPPIEVITFGCSSWEDQDEIPY